MKKFLQYMLVLIGSTITAAQVCDQTSLLKAAQALLQEKKWEDEVWRSELCRLSDVIRIAKQNDRCQNSEKCDLNSSMLEKITVLYISFDNQRKANQEPQKMRETFRSQSPVKCGSVPASPEKYYLSSSSNAFILQ